MQQMTVNDIEAPKGKKRKIYFGKEVQDAIIKFNNLSESSFVERTRLFNGQIYPAFMKLTENIINTWKFHRYETNYSDLQREVVCQLYTKISGYDESKGRAYSYFTIICKNYLIQNSQNLYKAGKAKEELDVVDAERNITNEIILSNYQETLADFLYKWCNWCEINLTKIFKSKRDQRVADSILELMKNSSEFDIYNKKFFYILIRERSNVDTQNITKVVKILKDLFTQMFRDYQKDGFINSSKYL
jgi:hypothetical protein